MKRFAAILLTAALLLSVGGVLATGGSSEDPLISLTYLNESFQTTLISRVDELISGQKDRLLAQGYKQLSSNAALTAAARGILAPNTEYETAFVDERLKKDDTLTLYTGSTVLVYAGEVTASFAYGTLVDITTGGELKSGAQLTAMHRYLVAEDTVCDVRVTGDSAVLAAQGLFTKSMSAETDYQQYATALQSLGLFRGTGISYGDGFALENGVSRTDGLIMFLRLIGEESAALSYSGTHPFTDVAAWSNSYVAYAYAKSYTNGVSATQFGSTMQMSAQDYVTFLLRALGYSDSNATDFSYSAAMSFAVERSILTSGERSVLEGESFNRAKLTYLSFYALEAKDKSGAQTLSERLIAAGSFTRVQYQASVLGVTSTRK